MLSRTLLYLFVLLSQTIYAQKAIYSKTVYLTIPPKKTDNFTDSIKVQIKQNPVSTIYVDIVDSLQMNDKTINSQILISKDTINYLKDKYQQTSIRFNPDRIISSEKISDYPSGKYLPESSKTTIQLVKDVEKAIDCILKARVNDETKFVIKLTGAADAYKIKQLKYKNEFGNLDEVKYFYKDKEYLGNFSKTKIVTKNHELAFLRAYGMKKYLLDRHQELREDRIEFKYYSEVGDRTGSDFRKVSIEIIIKQKI